MHSFLEDATLKELRRHSQAEDQPQLLQSCERVLAGLLSPGFQSKPWAGISERFQRCSLHLSSHTVSATDGICDFPQYPADEFGVDL
jgi:hypothetical protein